VEPKTGRDKYRIGEIVEEGFLIGTKRQKAEDLLSKAESGELPVYIELPVTPTDREKRQQRFVRIPAWEMTGTELAPTEPIDVEFGSTDHRYTASDETVWTPGDTFIKVDLGKVWPLDCVVFWEDLERLRDMIESQAANGQAQRGRATAEATPVSESVNVRRSKSRDEKMWLHVAVYALAVLRAKKTGNERFPEGRGTHGPVATNIARHTEAGSDTLVRVFRTARQILGGNAQPDREDKGALDAGTSTLKRALAFLAAEVYGSEILGDKAAQILDQLGGAPLNVMPTGASIEDALKAGQPLRG
jgi:hypothetical protein